LIFFVTIHAILKVEGKMKKPQTRLALCCALFLSSCGLGQALEPTITPSPTSTKRPTQLPSPTITPTPLGTSSEDLFQGTDKNEEEGEEEEIVECCDIMKVSNVHYESIPGVSRYLHFDLECYGNWPVSSGECLPGETFIGEPQRIPWTEVTCCAESDDLDVLHCESDYSVEQKVSWTMVKLEHRGCEWNSPRFYSPPYIGGSSPGCPFNQFMCAGTCCSPGHCCDCPGGAGLGCYDSCSECD
jgi:hypothetical protein